MSGADDLISALKRAGVNHTEKRPDGFGITIYEYARRENCTLDQARKVLEKAVEEGIAGKKIMLNNGAKVAVYYLLDN